MLNLIKKIFTTRNKRDKGKGRFFICDQGHKIDRRNPWQCKKCKNPPRYIII